MSAFSTLSAGSPAAKVRVFVSYDREHDQDLLDRIVAEAAKGGSTFEVSARSAARPNTEIWDHELREAIREADQVIVICGEHTDHASCVEDELRIAQEEERPYFLLWGRREPMCIKPTTARPGDSMYSWTPEILQNQILTLRRLAESNARLPQKNRVPAAPKG